ncbi:MULTISPECIES: ferritin-like domain-containing protein [unclassified Mesorhizobium]|uniref:ferritin-like domain-containing protein n=1 Tax=unclassified Mesorhizobium TaxID=325217 RepID=UPI001CCD090B|nr:MULTISPECIES: ferritin-like domain-containing protein [unclassified Mesorhizobium]MBZ9739983.1 ferritin-like domain-containing protein [Mesorhizobium sp. CO1-1-4]MBZ9806154.1 ferritin-like domain-containing protein [Mesorhizobium sp. ES1-6]
MSNDRHRIRDLYVTGLRNAHAMENQALSIMKPQLERIENYPKVAAKLDQHIRETEAQIGRLDSLLKGLGESNSTIKDMALSLGGTMAAMGHTVAGDEILKNSFANFAFENFEIAAYNSLLVIADLAGETRAEGPLRQNLSEEEGMARWLQSNLVEVTRQFAELKSVGEEAKV